MLNTKLTAPFLLISLITIFGATCKRGSDATPAAAADGGSAAESPHQETVEVAQLITPDPAKNSCVSCHRGIEPIRAPESGMMQAIYQMASKAGYPDNECIVCHGGNPTALTKPEAHSGTIDYLKSNRGPDEFYPDPASVWINDKTCGMCHEEQVKTQFTSLMFTEAGKIQGTTWGFGGIQGYNHNVANVAVKEVEVHQRLGSDVYKKYMAGLKVAEPQVFPTEMKELPPAPTPAQVTENPALAVYTYLRGDCQRCHTGVKGQNVDGDYRGTGCGSCHIPYSNKGLYEGDDPTVDRKKQGMPLVHSIQSSRDSPVTVNGHTYTGIPTKTCTACHNRGRRIGVSYEGLMESSYQSPFMSNGDDQKQIHKKNYIHLQPDLHLSKGMVCQDCHTSGDMHSLGDLSGAISGAVEIECQDCHGTPTAYPWELPIGYGDEIVGTSPKQGPARGVSQTVPEYLKKGWVAPRKDGYLLSSRGNPMPHVVKTGTEVILYSAGGKDLVLQPLKKLTDTDKLGVKARVAMVQVKSHVRKMECYACHATWAPQCYGCHVKIDYSKPKLRTDWVEVAKNPDKHGQTADAISPEEIKKNGNLLIGGEVEEQRSYLRWEDPPLVVNGEHRVSPAVPGCQTTVTVKDAEGNIRLLNHIFKLPNVEGARAEGQLAIDIAPLNPHTTQKEARSCESCHNNPKSMGYGIEEGKLYNDPSKDFVMDLMDAYGKPLAKQSDIQFNAIPNLKMDWSRFVDESGKQLQTVGHHFSGSRPLNRDELSKLDRRGVCLSCHQTVPDSDIAINLLSHLAKLADQKIDNPMHSVILHKSIRIAAWAQVLAGGLVAALLGYLGLKLYQRRKRKTSEAV
ncbi:MAG: hypothetical protein K9N23_11615 [Akkermansiaceae bacterium]|nr:hypothetical protein [Akkermansiaceae bacterium]MCF7732331.1 hypothetical protein [Akkermansiaceae bacterium]